MKKKKRVMMIVVIVLVIVLGGFIFKSCSKSDKQGSFQFAPIKRGDIENIVSSTGTLSAVETVEVGSQVSGIIEKIFVDFNDAVTKGEVLAVLDKTLFQVAVKDAQAGVIRAKARWLQAEAELNRNRPLFEKGHLAEMEFLVTQTTAETAKAELEIAEAALKRAQTNLDYTVIRSPISGTVIERTVDAGQTIAASFQAPKLFVIAEDLTRMQIEVNVDESDIGQIKTNQAVRFEVQAYPEEIFTGKVRQIRLQPTTIQNVVNYTVVVDASNEKGILLPGMTATVDFLVNERRDVLMVPNSALNFKLPNELMQKYGPQMMRGMNHLKPGGMEQLPDHVGVVFYLDENGIPGMTTLEKGISDATMTEIVKSPLLKEGMEVITAYKTGKSSQTKSKEALFLPRPPGGGPGGPRGH